MYVKSEAGIFRLALDVAVSEHFAELLDGAGTTYIVIDGLDEVDPMERRILLHQLASLDKCPEVKVMVGCRPEEDFARILDSTFTPIRVDKNNSGSIRLCVNHRAQKWIDSVRFDEDARKNLQHLLAPIVPHSNGMFLFAHVVLENTLRLTDLDEIEKELVALPTDLNDAYQRIFARINQLSLALKNKARKILGWIGCSPVPMTRLEMEQMLQIEPGCSGFKAAPHVQAELDFLALCAPLVEMVEDRPQFVHFTVKTYIFSQEISHHLEKHEAEYMLAKSSLAYLCSPVLELDASDDEIRKDILKGRYRLHSFVSSQWLAITGRVLSSPPSVSRNRELVDLLVRLTLERKNHRYKEDSKMKSLGVPASTTAAAFSDLHTAWPEVMQMIGQAMGFLRDDRHAEWNYTNGSTWVNFDPTTISSMSVRIHRLFEDMICNNRRGKHSKDCHCDVLRSHYGPRIFKCTYPSCDHSRHGFSERRFRDPHVGWHSRPWKCSVETCTYAVIGFATERGFEDHWQRRHLQSASAPPPSLTLAKLSGPELQVLVYELTKLGKVDELGHVVKLCVAQRINITPWLLPARILAAEMGSLPVLELLEEFDKDWIGSYCQTPFLAAVFRGKSAQILRWLITNLCRQARKYRFYSRLAAEAFGTDSSDMYDVWEEFLLNNTDRVTQKEDPYSRWSSSFIPAKNLIPLASKRYVLFSENAFCAVRKNVIHQIRLVQTWQRFIDEVLQGRPPPPYFLGWSLTRLATSSAPSVDLAATLLRLGAPIDFPRGSGSAVAENADISRTAVAMTLAECDDSSGSEETTSARRKRKPSRHRGMTALHHASRRATEQSARFMRFLLEQGADPNYTYAGEKSAQQPGARAMESFLGESWEHAVERTLPARLERKKPDGQRGIDAGGDEDDELEQEDATRTKRRRK